MVKIYRSTAASQIVKSKSDVIGGGLDDDLEFDIHGHFLQRCHEKEQHEDEDAEENKNKDGGIINASLDREEKNMKTNVDRFGNGRYNYNRDETRWIVLFYRIYGTADGFQYMMSKLFYTFQLFIVMDLTNDLRVGTHAKREQLSQLDEINPLFAKTFKRIATIMRDSKDNNGQDNNDQDINDSGATEYIPG